MTDFNYSEYGNDTLNYAIEAARKNIAEYKSTIKSLNKKLDAPRGYSKKKLELFEYKINSAERMIVSLTQEITECQEELAVRERLIYEHLDCGRSLGEIDAANDEIEADKNLTSKEKSEMLWANQLERGARCELIAQLRSIQGRTLHDVKSQA